MKIPLRTLAVGVLTCLCSVGLPPGRGAEVLSAGDSADLAAFEQEVGSARKRGATLFSVTAGLPPSLWEFDPPGDPYPAWYVGRASILKFFPPPELQPCVDLAFAARVTRLLEERCRILRANGMKGQWSSNEPQTLPEAFFTAHPKLRGPRVDQPNRSRVPRFAPCVDQPETLRLYREALQSLWRRCPEIVNFSFLTSDSGSGFCWVPALYPGINGHSDCRERPMAERVGGFLRNFQAAADSFGSSISRACSCTRAGARRCFSSA